MPDVYSSGAAVPELDGRAGGVTVVLHHPTQIEWLYAIATLAPRPPHAPLTSLSHVLADPTLDWVGWHRVWSSRGHRMPVADARPSQSPPAGGRWQVAEAPDSHDEHGEEISDVDALLDVLVVLRLLWESEPDDTPLLSCVVSIATGAAGGDTVSWEAGRPALAVGRGSWQAWCGRGVWTAPRFIAGLVVGGGIDAAARQAGMVSRARQRASRKLQSATPDSSVDPLPDIRDVLFPTVANSKLVVLLHGLCSIDVGTFGDFEAYLRRRPGVQVAGFPHDSLTTSIDENAKELAQVLRLLGKSDVRLVCHSRGGLVARRAHLLLQQRPTPGASIHSCATFGTPHLGTSVASSPISLTFACMALSHIARSPGAASVVDVLCARTDEGIAGVSELMPSGVKGSYLSTLEAAENRLFLNEGFNLHVFGSVAPRSTLGTRLMAGMITRVLGTPDHDLLVPTRSSLPRLEGAAPHVAIPGRSHFDYFTKQDGDPPHFAAAVQKLAL